MEKCIHHWVRDPDVVKPNYALFRCVKCKETRWFIVDYAAAVWATYRHGRAEHRSEESTE